MTPFLTALLLAGGGGVWVYGKIARKTGGNGRDSTVVAVAAGVILFGILFFVLNSI